MAGEEALQLGNYVLLLELTTGGMATVYLAKQAGAAGFERLVIIKRVHRHLLRMREFHDMFLDEARVASLIRHPNVVSVDDVVESSEELFLVQPYVESVSLAQLIDASRQKGENLPAAVVVRIIADALGGLSAAHDARDMRGEPLFVVHRDVSPHNILVGTDGRSRIIDFGIAKAARRITTTSGGIMKGKLAYMSPEQARQQPVDARADLFALGAVLHETLTGKQLFRGDDDADVLLNVLIMDVPSPSSLVKGVPSQLDAVVAKALEREPENRFQTGADFLEILEKSVQPAQGREVAQFVERLCSAELAARREAIKKSLDGPRSSGIPRLTPLPPGKDDVTLTEGFGSDPGGSRSKSDVTMAATQAAKGSPAARGAETQRSTRARIAAAAGLGIVGLLGAVSVIKWSSPSSPTGPASATPLPASALAAAPASAPAASSAPALLASTSASAPAASSAPTPATAAASASAPAPRAITSGAPASKPASTGNPSRPPGTPTGLKPNPFL